MFLPISVYKGARKNSRLDRLGCVRKNALKDGWRDPSRALKRGKRSSSCERNLGWRRIDSRINQDFPRRVL